MNKRYVITGAAGFIGLHLCQELLKTPGTTVVGIDNERSGDWSRVSPLVEQHKLDVGELTADDWKRLLMPGDVVFHLAAEKYNSSKSTPEKVLSCNVMGTEQMIRAAAKDRDDGMASAASLDRILDQMQESWHARAVSGKALMWSNESKQLRQFPMLLAPRLPPSDGPEWPYDYSMRNVEASVSVPLVSTAGTGRERADE